MMSTKSFIPKTQELEACSTGTLKTHFPLSYTFKQDLVSLPHNDIVDFR
ncbi:hypothetical protein [Microcystis sp. LSC13-02]|nr:hypothetical protein [Microcystis sp. LSC13-02]